MRRDEFVSPATAVEPLPMPKGPEPWLQMRGENNLWFERFEIFRDLRGHRSIPNVARKLWQKENGGDGRYYQPSMGNALYQAAKTFRWWERVRAYDENMQKIRMEEQERITRATVHSQHLMVEQLTNLTLARLQQMRPEELETPADVIKAFEAAVKTGNLVIGLPTDRSESSSVQFTINLSDRDLQKSEDDDAALAAGDDVIDAEFTDD